MGAGVGVWLMGGGGNELLRITKMALSAVSNQCFSSSSGFFSAKGSETSPNLSCEILIVTFP